MVFSAAGTNHRFAPIEIREKIVFSKKRLSEAVSFFGNVVILSTCNRVEIYTDSDIDMKWLLCRYHEVSPNEIYPYLYKYEGNEAFQHLCRVGSGLDSLIFGEREILGQVRFAYDTAKPKGLLNKMFVDAFRAVRRIRRKINVDASIGKTVKDFLGPVEGKKIIIIGRGEAGKSAASYLGKNCEIVAYADLKEKIKDADIVISATGSPHIVIRKEDVPKKPLVILDLAVPRDVDPAVKEIDGISLYCLDEICGRSVQEEAGLQLSRQRSL